MDISFLRAPTLAELRDSVEPLQPACQLGLESTLVRTMSVSQGGTFYYLFTWQILTLSSSVTERDSGIEQKLILEFWLHNNLESI